MTNRAGLEQEIADGRRRVAGLQEEIKAIRGYISANEHVVQSQPESLRAITQDGLARARANLAHKEFELQTEEQRLADAQRVLAKAIEVERKQQEVQKLERDMEALVALLERARMDLSRLEGELHAMTGPVSIPAYALHLADGRTLALPTDRAELLVGCQDQQDRIYPDVDLGPLGGRQSGVSRRHALLRWMGGHWTLTDLGSANGTFVNEAALAPNVPAVVQENSRIRFGAFAVTLRSAAPGKTVRL
ncbi:MAG TPA: FHA domain-containing protein [Roseiflexaceae bacterium]|nr:FHA domain-containing protein [Roseiflexaceae bacterium]